MAVDSIRSGRWLILTAALIWSLGGVLAKEIPLDGGPLAFYRSLIAGLILWPLAPRGSRVVRPALIAFAAKLTTAANAIYLQSSAIFWTVPLSAVWLKEKADRRSVAGIAVALVGVGLILVWGRDGRSGESPGILLGLASGVAYAVVVVGLRRFRNVDPTWLASCVNLADAGFLGGWLVLSSGSLPLPNASSWPLLIVLARLMQITRGRLGGSMGSSTRFPGSQPRTALDDSTR